MTTLRPWQERCVGDIVSTLLSGGSALWSAPTGSGKSYVLIESRRRLCTAMRGRVYITSPRVEILQGIARKLDVTVDTSREGLESMGLFTPIALRNRLLKGKIPWAKALLIDEAHHSLAETYDLLSILHGNCPRAGISATAYRGTPEETRQLHEMWGEPRVALSWQDARDLGYISVPRVEIEPLFDDDRVALRGSDFTVGGKSGLNATMGEHIDRLAQTVRAVWETDERPTILALPSCDLVDRVADALPRAGVPCSPVTQSTSTADREMAFSSCVDRASVLAQISVVGEGVDLPMRILIDAKPTMSPVAWLQLVGRITRPVSDGEPPPRLLVTCRNIERHAYLMEGLLPRAAVSSSQEAFGGPSSRSALRRLGLEAVRRFKTAVRVPLLDGGEAIGYNLYCWDEHEQRQYEFFVLLDPASSDVFTARRVNAADARGRVTWGKWQRCELPSELAGFRTLRAGECTPKQIEWWRRSAATRGLDPDYEPDRRSFAVLPVLFDTRTRL